MHGTILVYGNDAISVMTRCLILGKAGYEVFTAQTFGNAVLMGEAGRDSFWCDPGMFQTSLAS